MKWAPIAVGQRLEKSLNTEQHGGASILSHTVPPSKVKPNGKDVGDPKLLSEKLSVQLAWCWQPGLLHGTNSGQTKAKKLLHWGAAHASAERDPGVGRICREYLLQSVRKRSGAEGKEGKAQDKTPQSHPPPQHVLPLSGVVCLGYCSINGAQGAIHGL